MMTFIIMKSSSNSSYYYFYFKKPLSMVVFFGPQINDAIFIDIRLTYENKVQFIYNLRDNSTMKIWTCEIILLKANKGN